VNSAQRAEQEQDTRLRLIEAASEIFIEQGYQAAKIRDIVTRARANLAAINYYFGGKEGLYAAVIQHNADLAIADFTQLAASVAGQPPEAQLKEYIQVFLRRLLHDNVQSRMSKLIARESIEPTAAFGAVMEKFIFPAHTALAGIIRAIVGKEVGDVAIRRSSMSVIGQCLYYQNARRVVQQIDPDFRYRPEDIERLADHIVAFSLGGLRLSSQPRKN
jgi:TetR/AcrR family transcriptional regulator, regulator of cefoperazone and chloramphenicol sensitivity